jgi:hypothetical protein
LQRLLVIAGVVALIPMLNVMVFLKNLRLDEDNKSEKRIDKERAKNIISVPPSR